MHVLRPPHFLPFTMSEWRFTHAAAVDRRTSVSKFNHAQPSFPTSRLRMSEACTLVG